MNPIPQDIIEAAIRELDIDVPIGAIRSVGDRLELHLYGGRVLYWPPDASNKRTKSTRKETKTDDGVLSGLRHGPRSEAERGDLSGSEPLP